MQIEQVFDEALRHPAPMYALGGLLARAYPDDTMLELEPGYFDVESFAAEKHCTFELRSECYQQLDTHWSPEGQLLQRARIAWARSSWNGETFELVKLTIPGRYGMDESRTYLLGRERATCETFIDTVCRWNHEVRGEILVFKDGCFQKSAKLYAAVTATKLEQLVLEGTFKEQILADFTQFLASRETYEHHGVPWKRGALFIGPPGNGKTLCVKALIGALKIPCIYVQGFASPHSTPQSGIEAVFHRARSTTPCLIVLEDIDALLVEGSRSFFLNELDGFASNAGVITLATTNHPERLDPSIVERPSRFDRKYHFDLPTPPTRARYVAAWNDRLKATLRLSDEGLAQITERTDGFSFAYIQEVFVSSMMRWMSQRESTADMLAVALEQVELLRAQMQTVQPDEPVPPTEPPWGGPMPPHLMRYWPRRR